MHKVNIKRLRRESNRNPVYAAFYCRKSGVILNKEQVFFPLSDAVFVGMELSMSYGSLTPSDVWVCWDSETIKVFSLLGDQISDDFLSKIESLTIGKSVNSSVLYGGTL